MNKIINLIAICMILFSLNFISGVSITDVSSTPSEVAPGDIVEISIEIENNLNDDITNLNVKLDLSENVPFAPHQSSSEKFLEELDSDDEDTFKFRLIVLPETDSGIYKIPVDITYTDADDEDLSKSELISITVNSEPELQISAIESILIKGQESKLSIKIVNSGLADVKFVYVTVNDVSGIRILSEKNQYIGDIDSDDFDEAKYSVYVKEDAKSSISLPIILKFRDATNKEFIETKNLILKIYSLKEAQDLGLAKKPSYKLYIFSGILIVGYIIYRIRKKKKLRR